jgi:hypothetical protein
MKNKEMILKEIEKIKITANEEHDDIDDIIHDINYIK